MKIALAMAYDDSSRHGVPYHRLGDLSASNKRRYAARWGYDLVIENKKKDLQREMHWAKLSTLIDVLPDYDWVFWTDADSLVMNFNKKLEDYIDDSYSAIFNEDVNGLNSGHFFIRNSKWSIEFLRECYEIYPPPRIFANGRYHTWQDQAAIRTCIGNHPEHGSKIKLCPQKEFNSHLSNYEHGDFILHFSGGKGNDYKLAMMREYQDRVIV